MAEINAGTVIIGFAIALAIFSLIYVNYDLDENFFGERDERVLGNGSFVSNDLDDYDGSERDVYYIDIENLNFESDILTIDVGDRVVWINKDSDKHTVTSDSGSELDSNLLSKDDEYSHVFDSRGEFDYYCAVHPHMKGRIVVE